MRLSGVLLDVDGTLIDSNDSHAHAWVDALQEAHIVVPFSDIRPLIGMGGDKLLPKVANIDSESAEGKSIAKRRGEIFQENYLPKIRPFPAVRELLKRLKEQRLKLAVASSSKKGELCPLLQITGAKDLIDATTSSDDVDNSKPDSDIIHAALAKLGLRSEQVFLLGDTPYDVEAGSKAAVKVIALRCGGWKDSELSGAFRIYDDPQDLLERFEESPFV